MAEYTLEMRDDGGSTATAKIAADSIEDARSQIEGECIQWVEEGDWGEEGASIQVIWTLYDDETGDEVDNGYCEVEVEPSHSVLIRRACHGHDHCGDDPDDHDWTSQGEGGLDENPGVWSTGGTSMVFRSHCRRCGLHRTEYRTGSQRNPDEHDRVKYEMVDDEMIAAWRERGAMDDDD